jgi:hypothetical protein
VVDTTETAIMRIAITLGDLHNALAATLTTLGKQMAGHPSEARAELVKALDLLGSASVNLQGVMNAARSIATT